VIDTLLNLLFRCSHRHLTRPLTRVGETGGREGASYVVCLDCGKQFIYDLDAMRIGKPIDQSHEASVLPEKMPIPLKTKLKCAALAAVPVAAAIGVTLHSTKSRRPGSSDAAPEPAKTETKPPK
jgi:hypothetical protein